ERDPLQHLAAIDAEAAMEVTEILAQRKVLRGREGAITDVLVQGHAAGQRLLARADSAAEHNVADTQLDETNGVRNHAAIVLVVGMNHDDNVGAMLQRVAVTSLLIAAVATILWVLDDDQTHFAGHLHRAIATAVIHEDHFVDRADGHIRQRRRQCGFGVISREDSNDLVLTLGHSIRLRAKNAFDPKDLVTRVQLDLFQHTHGCISWVRDPPSTKTSLRRRLLQLPYADRPAWVRPVLVPPGSRSPVWVPGCTFPAARGVRFLQ